MPSSPPALPRRIAWFTPWTWKPRWLVLLAIAASSSYPLSFGPAYTLVSTGRLNHNIFHDVYWPLWQLALTHDAIGDPLFGYASWCTDVATQSNR